MSMYKDQFIIRASEYGAESNEKTKVLLVGLVKENGEYKTYDRVTTLGMLNPGEYNNFVVNDNKLLKGNGRDKCHPTKGCVIIAELQNSAHNAIGYKMVMCKDGKVVNVKTDKLVEYVKSGKLIIQNAMAVKESEDRAEHIRMFVDNQVEMITVGTKKPVVKEESTKVESTKAENKSSDSKFSDKQKEAIELAQRRYGIDLTKYVDETYSVGQMLYILACLSDGYNVSNILDSRLSDAQMAEIIGGEIDGLDVTSYKDPKLSLEAMRKIHDELYREMWFSIK